MKCTLSAFARRRIVASALMSAALGMHPLSASESIGVVNQFTTVAVEENAVLYQELPTVPLGASQAARRAMEALHRDIQALYPIGTPATSPFLKAKWVMAEDETMALLMPSPGVLTTELLLIGTWVQHDGVRRVHLAGRNTGRGLEATLDGLLQPFGEGYQLYGVYTVALRGARQVERLALRLTPAVDPLPKEATSRFLESTRRHRALEQSRTQERVLSEPDEYIGGVPVGTEFDVTLTGEVDGVAFGPLVGELLLRRAEVSNGPSVYLVLTTDGPVVPGYSKWITHRDLSRGSSAEAPSVDKPVLRVDESENFPDLPAPSPQTPESGVDVATEDGRIRIAITPALPFREVGWYTRGSEHPEDPARVLVETGAIELRVVGDQIAGSINAEGHVESGTRPSSRFSAKVEGSRQAGAMLEALKRTIGPRQFDGRWEASHWGVLTLLQRDAAVKGSFAKSGSLEGTAIGKVLDFHWKAMPNASGRGFLRATGSDLLAGMAWSGDALADLQPLVAIQLQPSTQAFQGTDQFPAPTTDAEARELKYLAYDLNHSGKHQKAAQILAKVIAYYQERAANVDDPRVHQDYLIAQGVAVTTWINSASRAGDYPLLLDALAAALDLERQSVPSAFGLRLFRQQAGKYSHSLRETAATMGLVAEAFQRGLNVLSGAGIGVSLEAASGAGGLMITGVAPNMPAGRAGVRKGEVLVAIDGAATASMDVEKASSLLRGSADTPVAITLLRNGQQREFKLVRAPLINLEPGRRNDVVMAVTAFRDMASVLREELTAEAKAVDAQASPAPIGFEDQVARTKSAFDELIALITRRQVALSAIHTRAASVAQQALAGRPEALELFQSFIALGDTQLRSTNYLDPESAARMLTLDQDFEGFKRKHPANDFDVALLDSFGNAFISLWGLRKDLAGRLQLAEQNREWAKRLPEREEIKETLAGLSSHLDEWRARLITDSAKIHSLELAQDVYYRYVQNLMDLDLPEEALVASEAARARAFADLMGARSAEAHHPAVDVVGADILSKFNSPPASLADLTDIVRRLKCTVVEYMVLPERLVIWVVEPSGRIETRTVEVGRARLEEDIRGFLDAIERAVDPSAMEALIRDQADRSARLHERLIKPIENLLPASDSEPIIIVPHRELFRIPFAALKNSAGEYLIQKHPILIASSITVAGYAQRNQRRRQTAAPILLALVNPKPLVGTSGQPLPYEPLDWTEQKVSALSNYYKDSKILPGSLATAEALRQEAKTYDVIYLATHAEASDEQALDQTFIALAGKPLTVFEVIRDKLELSADLVILGACKTGRGPITGDGVNGLNRAFTYAGAATLLTTLWDVPEKTTLDFLQDFHRFWLDNKMPKALAARAAQLKQLENNPLQIDVWSPMVMYGAD